ncbi:30S ribosomal protein S8 [PVC group bacterium]|nr:30S ribosomal protein S8 [PVC group bacterium]
MTMTDPIAAMLTKMRNAIGAKNEKVQIPCSKIKVAIAKILKDEGFIRAYKILEADIQASIDITLKYTEEGEPVMSMLRRVSKPGLRRYSPSKEIKSVIRGRGISILSTSKGIMTGENARKENVGGEVLCEIW